MTVGPPAGFTAQRAAKEEHTMRRVVVLTILLALTASVVLSGCSTLVETPQARNRRYKQVTDLQMKMAVEDWDYLWLYERNASTTQWHPWVGI